MSRRSYLKALHWTTVPFFVWFLLVQPEDVSALGAWAVRMHSVFGLIFVTLALVWTGDYLWRGLVGRPGPKLPGWARRVHWWLHRVIVWGLFGVALTGFLLGLTSARLLMAGGIVPIAPPLGLPRANEIAGIVHSVEFYGLAVIVAGHAAFHIWRHVRLRDNALRIMVPRAFYRFL
ncbi:cytochrome b [Anianabacter salinae]|uniref:cytochrome b n=1 Tax=Anianabacter salinae TaxID=2851023 RepID=UPI00225E41D3|nr:cytochrome b/b6 domain-containing protein [Anianabacter salinae]